MASSSVNFRRKARTVQQSPPDDPNPNTAEPMVKNAHRTQHVAGSVHWYCCVVGGSVKERAVVVGSGISSSFCFVVYNALEHTAPTGKD
jgi:hypothetical protein